MNAVTYLTRRCTHDCFYCALKNSPFEAELSVDEWLKAFQILKYLGVKFNLMLGNECWLLGEDLLTILKETNIPFGVYTSCPPRIFQKYEGKFFTSGILDNLSAGVDWPLSYLLDRISRSEKLNDTEQKSLDAWRAFLHVKKTYPDMRIDTHAAITIHRQNYHLLLELIEELNDNKLFHAINYIHWNKDGKYDFFPGRDILENYLMYDEDISKVRDMFRIILQKPRLLQNPEFIEGNVGELINMEWHCDGNPYDGPTVDADGSLRICGYLPGNEIKKMSIFDLGNPKAVKEWKRLVYKEAMKCGGCFPSHIEVFPLRGARKKISDVYVGDILFAMDEQTGSLTTTRVVKIYERYASQETMVKIMFADGRSIYCTEEHPFHTISNEWKTAKTLQSGDMLTHFSGLLFNQFKMHLFNPMKGCPSELNPAKRPEVRRKISLYMQKNNPMSKVEYRNKLKHRYTKANPSTSERRIIDLIISEGLPIKYIGDRHFWIGTKNNKRNPDFVVIGKKKIIEIIYGLDSDGCFFGKTSSWMKERKEFFSYYGYESLFIDVKNMTNLDITKKLWEFATNGIEIQYVQYLNTRYWNHVSGGRDKIIVYNLECSPHNNFIVSKNIVAHNCGWVFPWLYHHWQDTNKNFTQEVFNKHRNKFMKNKEWASRRVK